MTPIGNPDLSVSFAGIELKNPIIAASGTSAMASNSKTSCISTGSED